MLAALGLHQSLSGFWAGLNTAPPPLKDANGTTLTVGATVKLVGVVQSLDINAPHYNGVVVKLVHPNGNGPLVGTLLSVDPSQVVTGS